jgi:hypothetical protein
MLKVLIIELSHCFLRMNQARRADRERFTNPYLILLAFLISASFSFAQKFPLATAATRVLVDSLANQINRYYVDRESAKKMSAHLRKRFLEGKYNGVRDPHLLAGLLTTDVLSVCRDEHFHVEYNPELSNEAAGNIEDVPKMVSEKLKMERARNFGFRKIEILNGNIGYLEITSFSRLNQYSRETADAALRMLGNASALIIDLRYGVGGSPDMVNHIMGKFFKDKVHTADIFIRSENATMTYWTTPDSTFGNLSSIPIYVLTSYKTFSAAEGLTYQLQVLHRATIVGETTRGGAHTVTYRPLSSGFVTDIPFGRALDPATKQNWEGKGITPDIKVEAELALEAAEAAYFEKAFAVAKDSAEKRTLRWQYDLLKSANHPYASDSVRLRSFSGRFGPYNISYKGGTLFYQKTGKARFPLVPMGETKMRPKGNDTFVVEFIRDTNGLVNRLASRYDDGRVELADRSD